MSYKSIDQTDIIRFENSIIVDKDIKKGKQHLCYKLEQWKKKGTFDMMKNIVDNITLVKLMDSLGNLNHAVSVVGGRFFILITKKPYH